MKSRLIEFSLISGSYFSDSFGFSVFRVAIDNWDRSLFYVGKDMGDWGVDIFFVKVI